jgi:tetratricopeptide (TPR) repeat protein
MNYVFCQLALFIWLPVVAAFFAFLPPRRAVVVSFVVAWLALPNISFPLSGVPDYTKMSATVAIVLLCMLIFDQARLFTFRPRWYDLPMVVWCLCMFISAVNNGLGPYEGLAAMLDQLVPWGFPYLIGRCYFTDLDGMRELAMGIAIGGLIYVPLCLFEIRMSPVLETWVYGISHFEPLRFGGYRPKVFLSSGLELGMWMTNSTLLCYQLWASGTVKNIHGFGFGKLLLIIIVTTVLCKSTGAIALLVVGVVALWITRRIKWSLLIWLLLAVPPAYTISRGFNLWSGREAVEVSLALAGNERAQSLDYRLGMENMLAGRAVEQPIFGWGRFNRNQVTDSKGKVISIPDSLWILAFGCTGLVGLGSLLAVMLLPMALTLCRFPVATWSDPRVGPAIGLGMVLVLMMVDFLSNAMINPIYALVMGGLVGQSAVRLGRQRREAQASLANASDLMAEGRVDQAELEFRQAIELASDEEEEIEGRRTQAEALDGLGHSLLVTGRGEEAEQAFRDALAVRDWLAARTSDPRCFRDLAIAREGLSRTLSEIGRTAEAIEERRIALQVWDILRADYPRDSNYRKHRVDALNDLAWLLATDPDPSLRDPVQALHLVEEAVRSTADHHAFWNTLGVARYRAGDWAGAIEALEHSVLSSPDCQGTAFDHFFMAMAWCQLQHEDRAREWLERGIAWVSRYRPSHPALERFREETETLLMSEHGHTSLDLL